MSGGTGVAVPAQISIAARTISMARARLASRTKSSISSWRNKSCFIVRTCSASSIRSVLQHELRDDPEECPDAGQARLSARDDEEVEDDVHGDQMDDAEDTRLDAIPRRQARLAERPPPERQADPAVGRPEKLRERLVRIQAEDLVQALPDADRLGDLEFPNRGQFHGEDHAHAAETAARGLELRSLRELADRRPAGRGIEHCSADPRDIVRKALPARPVGPG